MKGPTPRDRPELPLEMLDRIDQICDRFEAGWKSGDRLRIEDRLEEVEATFRPALLSDLLSAEVAARRREGERPEARDYAGRFPDNPEAIAAAFAASPDPSAGDGPTAMSHHVVGIVCREERTPRDAACCASDSAADGRRFLILRPLARGGLGAVFVAIDRELHREVALKRMRRKHARNPASRSRFLLEAEVTGGLEHPGIVPVYGLGASPDGCPYYAMRLVRGDSLKQAIERFHADAILRRDPGRRSLELRKLLRRFLDVCNAIDYAHGRGVLHRDIKPANIIVGPHGETLVVDWGLAKPIESGGAALVTGEQPFRPSGIGGGRTIPGSVMGTPSYMSPEQARGEVDELDPRSDIYGLGATLYCLLAGRPPLDGEDVEAVLDRVQRGELPPPRRLVPMLDRPLEAICLKAMAPRPEDRYQSARALADDIERWMADEPVSAGAEPWADRGRRWSRRHRTVVVTSAWMLAASVIGLTVGLFLLRDRERQADRARRDAITGYEAAVGARRDVDRARRDAEANFARALDAVETMLVDVSERRLVDLPHFEPVRRRLLEDALAFHQGFLARAEAPPEAVIQAARAYRLAGEIHRRLGRRELARKEFDRADWLLEPLAAGFDRDVERSTLDSCWADLEYEDLHFPEAIAGYRRSIERRSALFDLAPSLESRLRLLKLQAAVQSSLGLALARVDQFVLASEALRDARATLDRSFDAEPGREEVRFALADIESNAAAIAYRRNQLNESIAGWTRAIQLLEDLLVSEPDSIAYRATLASSYHRLAPALARLRRVPEAIDAGRRAIDLYRQLALDYPSTRAYREELAAARHHLGAVYHVNYRPGPARAQLLLAIEAMEALVSRDPANPSDLRDLANSLMLLGNAERRLGDLGGSQRHLERARAGFEEAARLRPDVSDFRSDLASAELNRALTLERAGRLDRAEEAYRSARGILSDLTERHPENPVYRQNLANVTGLHGRCLRALGGPDDGREEVRRALELWDRVHPPSPRNPGSLAVRGKTWLLLGRVDDAVQAAEALAALRGPDGRGPFQAARLLAFNLPLPGPDPLAAARVPAERAGDLADRAMDFLRQAIAQGSFQLEEIEGDDDLESLRARADFPGLLQRVMDRTFPVDPFAR